MRKHIGLMLGAAAILWFYIGLMLNAMATAFLNAPDLGLPFGAIIASAVVATIFLRRSSAPATHRARRASSPSVNI